MIGYVCVLSTDNYLNGILVLNENLKALKSRYNLLCIINEKISENSKIQLEKHHIPYVELPSIPYVVKHKSHWNNTFDKLNIFLLEGYKKIIYLDADLLLLENIDFLFDYNTPAMVIDRPSHTDKYNSGLMVISPSKQVFDELLKLKKHHELENSVIGDQDILNEYYKTIQVVRIADRYNVIRTILNEKVVRINHLTKKEEEIYKVVKNSLAPNPACIHYVGNNKPFTIDNFYDDEYAHLYYYYYALVKNKKL